MLLNIAVQVMRKKRIGNEGIVSYQVIDNTPFILKSYEKIHFTQVLTDEAGKILAIVFFCFSFSYLE